jgi:hypothetical protein
MNLNLQISYGLDAEMYSFLDLYQYSEGYQYNQENTAVGAWNYLFAVV